MGKCRDNYIYYGRSEHRAYSNGKHFTTLRKNRLSWLQAYSSANVKAVLKDFGTENAVKPHLVNQVGIDRNCGQVALSDGRIFHLPDTDKLERRRRRYQKQLSRQQKPNRKADIKPSQRYLKTKLRHAKTQQKITQIRTNWCHQVSREIANKYDQVFVEALNTKEMTARAHNKGVAQKRGLNRSILASGWSKLEQFLSYKTNVVKVPAAYTSQTCNACGHSAKANRKSQAEFLCVKCGHEANADINASLNILAVGIAATARGDSGVSRSVKRECEMSDYVKLST